MKKLFKGGWVIYGDHRTRKDILVEGDKIAAVDENMNVEGAKVIDVAGKFLFPGFIDPHTHFELEVSNTVTADDFYSGTRAAVGGGTTVILDFATQNRGETLAEAYDNWNRKSAGKCSCDYGFHMAISEWNEAVDKEIIKMVERGITSFKLYMTYDAMYLNDGDIYKALKRIGDAGGLVGVHCENRQLIDALIEEEKSQGNWEPYYHHMTRPPQAEGEAVHRLLDIAATADTPVMIVHLSTKEGFDMITYARAKGQRVYVETCPQYLVLTEEKYTLPGFAAAKYVIAPPLRSQEDQMVLWDGVKNNQIQTIATDHCSFTLQQKELGKEDFTRIPCGMPGVETRPSLVYTYGVKTGIITDEQMCALLSENPARLYGLYPQKGTLLPGSDADIVVWDPEARRTLSAEDQLARVDYHPYEGIEVYGMAQQVYLRGELVAQNGKVLKENTGIYLVRKQGELD